MNRDEWLMRMCLSKRTYRSRRQAKQATRGVPGRKLWPYRCLNCDGWHTTTRRKL